MMNRLLIPALITLFAASPAAANEDELLAPEEAFQIEARAGDANTLDIGWKIAEGYYLYRHAFKFSTETSGYEIGEPDIPHGKVKKDEWFGEVETYRHNVNVRVPVQQLAGAARQIELTSIVQGCADIGVCYPPLTQKTVLTLPDDAGAGLIRTGGADPLAALNALTMDLGGEDEFLPVDEAFRFSADAQDARTLAANFAVAEGYYLYKDKMKFTLEDSPGVTLGAVELPSGKIKEDEFFGRMEIYETDRAVKVPLIRTTVGATDITLIAEYQGCAVAGICYPPVTKQVKLTLPPGGGTTGVAFDTTQNSSGGALLAQAGVSAATTTAPAFVSEQDRIAATLSSGTIWLTVLSFFGFGLLLTFTPCVFPMIPILSGIIAGQGQEIGARKAFILSLIYVLAMALTYTVAGVLVGMSGENVQAWFQNPWIISTFAGVFVLLSLAMFGFYELQMPSAIQNRLAAASNSQQGGTYAGAAIMGFLSALIVGPCVTAPLVGALIYIAQTGDATLGGMALFALSMGMGAPLIVIGTSAGKFMPRAGAWMDTVKAVFGVLMLALAIWLLERILPPAAIMVLSGVLLIITGIYLGAFEAIKEAVSGWFRLWKGCGQVMFVYGVLLLVGAAAGGHSILQPLKGVLVAGNGTQQQLEHGLEFRAVKGVDGLQNALQAAAEQGKPVMLDFYADWCVSCKEMEAFTFSDPGVQAALNNTVLIQADVTANDEHDKKLLKALGLFGPPAILFYDTQSQEQRPYRVVGFMPAKDFSRHVQLAFSQRAASL